VHERHRSPWAARPQKNGVAPARSDVFFCVTFSFSCRLFPRFPVTYAHRWREDVIRPDGNLGRIQRSIVIGLVSEVPTRRQAQIQLDQHLQMLNQGRRPQAAKLLQAFVECEWTTLVLSTLKLSTQRGYGIVSASTCCPALVKGVSATLRRKKINFSTVFAGQAVGIKEVHDGIWLVSFMDYDLGYFDLDTRVLQPLENPFGPKLLPM
jgi:hypothetical protein